MRILVNVEELGVAEPMLESKSPDIKLGARAFLLLRIPESKGWAQEFPEDSGQGTWLQPPVSGFKRMLKVSLWGLLGSVILNFGCTLIEYPGGAFLKISVWMSSSRTNYMGISGWWCPGAASDFNTQLGLTSIAT